MTVNEGYDHAKSERCHFDSGQENPCYVFVMAILTLIIITQIYIISHVSQKEHVLKCKYYCKYHNISSIFFLSSFFFFMSTDSGIQAKRSIIHSSHCFPSCLKSIQSHPETHFPSPSNPLSPPASQFSSFQSPQPTQS